MLEGRVCPICAAGSGKKNKHEINMLAAALDLSRGKKASNEKARQKDYL